MPKNNETAQTEAAVTFATASAALVGCIRDDMRLTDLELEALVSAQADDGARKLLLAGLTARELIDDDQAAFAFGYRWPLKGA